MRTSEYFITEHQRNELLEAELAHPSKKYYGTVGAVALDLQGNLAAATSTGGIVNSLHGRIGDSCIIGAGCYANNEICAVSCTGDGELIMTRVIAHKVAMLIDLKGLSVQDACNEVILNNDKPFPGDAGIIGVDAAGNLGVAFNSQRMHRAWINTDGQLTISIYDQQVFL
jgi:beta-aspartyl-peptidase (threonine type)